MHLEHTSLAFLDPINQSDLLPVGRTLKPHALSGEIACELDIDPSALLEDESERFFLFIELDALPIPFRVLSYRSKRDLALLRFAEVNNSDEALRISGCKLYIQSKYIEDEAELNNPNRLLGYHIIDKKKNEVGEIVSVDESTINPLFELCLSSSKDKKVLIPAAKELIIEIDHSKKTIELNIPSGILDL